MGLTATDITDFLDFLCTKANLHEILEFITIWVILCLLRQEAQIMLRYRDIPTHPTEV